MASTDAIPVPKKNTAYRLTIPILDADGDPVTTATIDSGLASGSGKVRVSKDGGASANSTNSVVEIDGGFYYVDLTATEMNADTVAVMIRTTTAGAKNTPVVMYPQETGDIVVTANAVTDKSGYFLASVDSPTALSGTAQAGAASSITLAAGASSVTDYFVGAPITITSGTGSQQTRTITAYNGSTKVATVDRAWGTNPDNTSFYCVLRWVAPAMNTSLQVGASTVASGGITAASFAAGAIDAAAIATDAIGSAELAASAATEIAAAVWDELQSGHTAAGTFGRSAQVIRDGTAQAGAAGSITLDAGASATDGFYTNQLVQIVAGTGAGQARQISGYTGATKVATVSPNWTTTPDNTSVFVLLPFAPSSGASAGTIAAAVWDEARSGHTTAGTFGRSAQVIRDGTAQAGAGGSITLDAGASASDSFYNACLIEIVSGTGAGQSRFINGYTGATKVATVQGNWLTAPDNTSVFVIYPFGTIASIATVTGNVNGSVGSIAAGGISAASFAANAIDAAALATGAATEIAGAVWDEARSSHVAAGSFGRAAQIIRDATAQAGAAGSITLDAGASATDSFYNSQIVLITGGTGVGQARPISTYTGSTKVATVSPNWVTTPDNTSVFIILPVECVAPLTSAQTAAAVWDEARSGHTTVGSFGQGVASVQGNVTGSVASVTAGVTVTTNNDKTGYSLSATESNVLHSGTAQAGAASSITLAAGASATTDLYKGLVVKLVSGTGAGQARTITAYNGSTKVATVDRAWATNPDNTTGYGLEATDNAALSAALEVVAGSLGTQAKADVNAEVVDVLTVDTFAEAGSVPAATSTLKDKINWLFILARNKITQTSTTETLRNDSDAANVATATVSDDSTTFTRGKWA